MAIPKHYLYVYQRPKQGSAFVKRFEVYNYQHTINAMGWFETANCDILTRSANESNDILNSYIGNFIQVFVDNVCEPIWEGLINRITFNAGQTAYTISLDEMANRMSCLFTGVANATGQTIVVNNTNSQAIFGIKEDQIEFGPDTTAGAANQRSNLQNTILNQRAFPQTSITQGEGASNLVHLEFIGIYQTLEWEKQFTAAVTTNTAVTTKINNTLAALANGTTFFDSSNTTQVGTNAMTVPDQQRGVSTWEMLQKFAEGGDATNYWIIGILPTNKNTGKRLLYYRQFNSTTEYTALQKDGLRVRNLYGKLLEPWKVVPDRVIRVSDALTGFGSTLVNDPRLTYIQSIQYDANSQKVQWLGTDDTTARAAFQLRRRFKQLSKNMPNTAPFRTIST